MFVAMIFFINILEEKIWGWSDWSAKIRQCEQYLQFGLLCLVWLDKAVIQSLS